MLGNIIVFQIDASKLNKQSLTESFDHSEEFFKCKAYLYGEDIKSEALNINAIKTF